MSSSSKALGLVVKGSNSSISPLLVGTENTAEAAEMVRLWPGRPGAFEGRDVRVWDLPFVPGKPPGAIEGSRRMTILLVLRSVLGGPGGN